MGLLGKISLPSRRDTWEETLLPFPGCCHVSACCLELLKPSWDHEEKDDGMEAGEKALGFLMLLSL